MGYFADNSHRLKPLSRDDASPYRECQVGAAWATLAHFTASTEPALISMPTGSGKTALMMMLAFLLKPERVIIITPSVALRGQTATKFRELTDLKSAGALPPNCRKPNVHEHTGQLSSAAAWQSFMQYDVIVATPHTTSPGYEEIIRPTSGSFGAETLLIVDEAHHSRARTWQVLIETFNASRIILLTATPFRNDNRRLLAKLVYHYPMRKAMDAGIYAPITYHQVDAGGDAKKKDEALRDEAVRVYREHRQKHAAARLLIRAEGVSSSSELLTLYRAAGITVEEVNYKKTLDDNRQVLNDLRAGSIDAVVCIDQIGEGLDIPSLKVAVLHKPRQSFPATVQFVGRICREATGDIGRPHLIACPDDVRGPLQRLYTHDNSWGDFVPEMVDQIVGRAARRSAFHGVVDVETELDLQVEDIQPFFSIRAYDCVGKTSLTFEKTLELKEDVVPVFVHEIQDKDVLVIVTGIERTFPWAEEADLSAPHFDLHVFYWHAKGKMLFEYTTSDKIANAIRRCLWGESIKRISASIVGRALRQASASKYLMFGLSNLARGSGVVPSYKTYMGTEVEGAVRPSDSRSFTPGHALAKYSTGETRGVAGNNARVWSIQRGTLSEFRDWCDQVATCLCKKVDGRLPNVEFLPAPESIAKFPVAPLAMYARWQPGLRISFMQGQDEVLVDDLSFTNLCLSGSKKEITGTLSFGDSVHVQSTDFTLSLASPTWRFTQKSLPPFKIDDANEIHYQPMAEFLDAHPPIIVLEDGSTVIGGHRFEPRTQLSALPPECLDGARDWTGCDIHVEFEYIHPTDSRKSQTPQAGKRTIHDQLQEWLITGATQGSLVIKDHASGEIADFIELAPDTSTVRFYHCKACSHGKDAGARIGELKALEQALRTVNHIGGNALVSELHERVTGNARPETRLVVGTPQELKTLADRFHANEWQFEVVLVNPGIDCQRSITKRNTNTLLIACYEWLGVANAKLKVIGQ